MIQRIQTIFYLLAAVAFITMFYLPFASSDVAAGAMFQDKLYTVEDHLLLGGLCLFGSIMAVAAIFLFKNRPLQLRLGYALIVFSILIVIAAIMLFINDSQTMSEQVQISEQIGLGMPILAIIFAVLANRFVKKDENLVRSMDRLR